MPPNLQFDNFWLSAKNKREELNIYLMDHLKVFEQYNLVMFV